MFRGTPAPVHRLPTQAVREASYFRGHIHLIRRWRPRPTAADRAFMTPLHSYQTLIIPLAAALICTGLIVMLHPLLQRYALARPNARSSHVTPTPQGGGIAVMMATAIAASLAGALGAAFG